MPKPYRFSLPVSFNAFFLFVIMIILALLLITSISLLINILCFITLSRDGIITIILIISEVLAGAILPLPFMPKPLYLLAYIMPFRLVIDLPFRTYVGNISFNEGMFGILLQFIWIIIIIFLGYKLLNKILKRVVIQGG